MRVCRNDHWQVRLPDDWLCENEEGTVGICHPDGVGELEISASVLPASVSAEDLRYFASDQIEHGVTPAEVTCGVFAGIELIYEHDGWFWHDWFLGHDNVLLLASYTCPAGEEEKEEAMLDVILATLRRSEGT